MNNKEKERAKFFKNITMEISQALNGGMEIDDVLDETAKALCGLFVTYELSDTDYPAEEQLGDYIDKLRRINMDAVRKLINKPAVN